MIARALSGLAPGIETGPPGARLRFLPGVQVVDDPVYEVGGGFQFDLPGGHVDFGIGEILETECVTVLTALGESASVMAGSTAQRPWRGSP